MVNFTVSYDYELFWGMHRNLKESYMRNSISNANSAALQIFNLHEKLEFPATWAVVGIAVDNPCSQEEYEYFLKHYKGTISAEMKALFDECVARPELSSISSLFHKLKLSNLQELGSHTYYHTFFDDHAADSYLGIHDFEKFHQMAAREGFSPVSFVCPKNIFTNSMAPVLMQYGFKVVRVNPDNALYNGLTPKNVSFINRVFRALDFFTPINELLNLFTFRTSSHKKNIKNGNLKFSIATLFFRGATDYWALNELALLRFKLHCKLSIFFGNDIHLWTHPHNFGRSADTSLYLFERYLNYVKKLESKGILCIKSMSDL